MEAYRSPADRRWWRLLVAAWALVGLGVLLYVAGRLLGSVSTALTPFALATVIVFLLRRPVALLELRGVPRPIAVGMCYLGAALVLSIAGVFLVPPLIAQFSEFLRAFPGYYDRAYELWQGLWREYQSIRLPEWIDRYTATGATTLGRYITGLTGAIAAGAVAFGQSFVGFVLNLVLALVIAFYLLKDYNTLREEVLALAGPKRRDEAEIVMTKVSRVLGGYLRGQLIVSAIVGFLIWIGLALIGVPYALAIGVIAGLFNVVPYLGPIVGGAIAAISGAFVSPWLALWAIVVVFAVQQVDSVFISPRVMSEQVDLYPVLVIFSLLVGGVLFGFVGLLLAIPVAAVAKGLFVYYYEKNTQATLATQGGVLFKQPPGECPEDMPAEECEDKTEDTRSS